MPEHVMTLTIVKNRATCGTPLAPHTVSSPEARGVHSLASPRDFGTLPLNKSQVNGTPCTENSCNDGEKKMKKWVRIGLALVVTGSMMSVQTPKAEAGFGLLKKLFAKKSECCCEPEPVCCEPEPEPVCCEPEPEPVCCEPAPEPVCCEPEPEPVCCEPEPEPVCCEPEPAPEPEPVCCEPEPEPEPCCASHSLPKLAPGEVLVSISPILIGPNAAMGTTQVAVSTPVAVVESAVMLVGTSD